MWKCTSRVQCRDWNSHFLIMSLFPLPLDQGPRFDANWSSIWRSGYFPRLICHPFFHILRGTMFIINNTTYLLTYPPRYTHWWSSSSVCRDWTFLFRSVKCLTQKMKLCPFVRSFIGGDNKRFPAAIKKLFPTSDRHSELIEIRDHFSWREWYWRPPLSINSRIGAYR